MIDIDDNGGISFREMQAGLLNIQHDAPIMLTVEDWHIITEHGVLCNGEGELDRHGFRVMLQVTLPCACAVRRGFGADARKESGWQLNMRWRRRPGTEVGWWVGFGGGGGVSSGSSGATSSGR